ncbi:DUF1444 family protein [uncultured Pseudoteredinibacter sp.]|uniref:DUF1444 family protein n=1 Tax=uncultured Pseudoteredinibacter sp. TaxID=1641701 RepID=UPI0026275E0D|nr:DUF1444 family protein [uncultured Pseudoteredinibacter sp.]
MRKIIAVWLFLLTVSPLIMAGNSMGADSFAKKYIAFISKLYPTYTVEKHGELEVRITAPGGEKMTAFLDNAYTDYINDPDDLERVLTVYSKSIAASLNFDKAGLSKDQLVPVIKNKAYLFRSLEMLASTGKAGLVYEKLNDELYVLYAFDAPNAMRFLTEADLDVFGLVKSELRTISTSNLRELIPGLKLEGDPASLSMVVVDGNYESSSILFDDIWTDRHFPVEGDIVVYILARDLVLVTGSKDKESLNSIQEIIGENRGQFSHPVSELGFVLINGQWKLFSP